MLQRLLAVFPECAHLAYLHVEGNGDLSLDILQIIYATAKQLLSSSISIRDGITLERWHGSNFQHLFYRCPQLKALALNADTH